MSDSPERALWRAVMSMAIREAMQLNKESKSAAIFLVSSKSRDRDLVASFAGIDEFQPERLASYLKSYARGVRRGRRPYVKDGRLRTRKPRDGERMYAARLLEIPEIRDAETLDKLEAWHWVLNCVRHFARESADPVNFDFARQSIREGR